ncbi:protein kinase domain-containing protein [Komagataeibacter xylinus]|uniref:protein kinase domain-containing protein n=1 Tax=Komagataeibacter xylinus TaxID=28448 RepID=UPI00280AEC0D|nr:tetratricopeptide repeat protein [Komagataeibacter xylinus]
MNLFYSPGDKLGNDYVIRRPLGQGGMGEVYLVEHLLSGQLRAAKVMRGLGNATESDLADFRREARSLLDLGDYPFVTRLFEVREEGRNTVLLMEYVAPDESGCTTLGDRISRTQDYDERLIGIWSVAFCVGMEHALRCGIAAHRDIKPGNLLLGASPFLKIADFGLAMTSGWQKPSINDTSKPPCQLHILKSESGELICGTPGYIAPELFANARASQQSDMFSFGITLWQLAARTLASPYDVPFQGDIDNYQSTILEKIHEKGPTFITSPYSDVISRCLNPDPQKRFSDFPALREAIKASAKSAGMRAMDFMVAPGFRAGFDDYVNRGRSYLVLGRDKRALKILTQAVKHHPNSPEALTAQGEALMQLGKSRKAVAAFEAARSFQPGADGPLIGLARAWLVLDNREEARAAVSSILSRHPENLEALLISACIISMEGNDYEALDLIMSVVSADPKNWRAYDYLGRVLHRLKKLDDAADAFTSSLHLNPLATDTRLSLAAIRIEQKKSAAADIHYQKAISFSKDNPETLNKIAAHMAEHGHPEKAIKLFNDLAETNPQSRSIMQVNIGNAYLRMGKTKSAIRLFREAIKIDSKNSLAYWRLGEMHLERKHSEKAVRCFERSCSLEPENARYHGITGSVYLELRNPTRARIYLCRSIKLYPEQPETLYNLAIATLFADSQDSVDRNEIALDVLSKAVQISKTYARAWFLKSAIEQEMGRLVEATISARHAVANIVELSAPERKGLHTLLERIGCSDAFPPETMGDGL